MFVNECIKASWFCLLIGFGFIQLHNHNPILWIQYILLFKWDQIFRRKFRRSKPNGYWITYYQNGNKKQKEIDWIFSWTVCGNSMMIPEE